ncbi:Pc12g01890 [Penicillium rubens Wisconsin 54-1255]|uniref:Pc12g01890 protein n=1 Tax=Penicillium rubens (strain ATCC 28089 / DSM 1075 / NRRL 1951 / Wisconsin 54-1255) TaxID=500485 RepID=B6GZD2_PENRW|nr:Pc12g01890 [Penicillium rubens Wisconsin 54-1255]
MSRTNTVPTPAPPLGDILATIQRNDLEGAADEKDSAAHITGSQYLTSYNWLDKSSHQIIVPGEPPAWTPLSRPTKLREDSDQYYRDPNAARYPTYPLEPMIRAILTDKPDFSLADLDIVGCGSTMGNLLRFARGQNHPFRMIVELVGQTVFLVRRENSPTERIPNVRGYGHTFPEAYTTWSARVKGSESHQRMINYNFAGINCLVRFQADGYLPDMAPGLKTMENSDPETKKEQEESLLASLEGTAIASRHPIAVADMLNELEITKGGQHIPQSAVFDLKTRSIKRMDVDTLGDELARLWIGQIPNFVLAYHKYGTFEDIRVQDVREKIKQWESSHQVELVKFANLLHMIISFVRSTESGRIEIEHEEGVQTLNLRAQAGVLNNVLPVTVRDKWDHESDLDESPIVKAEQYGRSHVI